MLRLGVRRNAAPAAGADHRLPVDGTVARPRVAILSTWHPEPADNGRKQRTRFIIESLAPAYDVVLVSLLPEGELVAGLPLVAGVWKQYSLPLPVFQPRSVGDLLRGASWYPRSISATWRPDTARDICDIVDRTEARVVIGTDLRTLRYLESLAGRAAVVLDEPDVSPFVAPEGWRSPRARLRELKFERLLRHSAQILSSAIVASEQEASAYRTLSEGGHVTIVENGVPGIPETAWRATGSTTLIYTGSVSYGPNAEAVEYIVKSILPLLPDVSLTVTGARPDVLPAALNQPRVHLTGRLESLDEVLLRSGVFVAPILSGTGTRIKLLEAMSYGMPIVSTPKGAEGLPVVHGRHLVLANRPAEFAAAIRELLLDRDLSLRLGAAARALVSERFTWDAQRAGLRALVDGLVTDG